MAKKKWSDLDPRVRKVVLVLSSVEAGLKIAALIDLAQRPADTVRGSKLTWGIAIGLVNSCGVVPILYLLRGRRPS